MSPPTSPKPSTPTLEDEAEYLGFQLGFDGIDADLPTPDASVRAAFERGLNAGDDHLWRVDPAYAEHLRSLAKRSHADDCYLASNPAATWNDSELAEAVGECR